MSGKDSTLVVDEQTALAMRERGEDGLAGQEGLPMRTFEKWMADTREQPAWRQLADKCSEYYDGNQLTAEQLGEMERTGRAPIVANIVRPIVDVVLGMEAKTRQDWRVVADSDEFQDVAEAESAMLAEAERESRADRACSDAYAGQIKAGIHWVEVSRNLDPLEYPYRVRAVHRREIWWDFRAKEPDLADARYLLRRRWLDLDELMAIFPDKAEVLEHVGSGRRSFERFDLSNESIAPLMTDAHLRERTTSIDEMEWRDTGRRMLCLTELWYRTWHRGHVIKIGSNVIPVDIKRPEIAAAIAYGKIEAKSAMYSRVRQAWWVGPHCLSDTETKKRRFPYVPFWGFKEDRTGIPYGLIRPMIDPQDEYNARRSKLMWLLSAKRVFADSDVLDANYNDFSQLADEIGRPDATVILNPNRKPGSTIRVETDHQLASQQFQVMHDAQSLLQQTAGVYQAMMGQTGQATSGLAINSLVEQGATTLAEINDNYRYARRLVGEMLLALIVEDIGGAPYPASVGDGKRKREVVLNLQQPDGSILNDTLRAQTKVALSDVPSTPAYRAQQLSTLSELTKSLPPNIQAAIVDFVVEATDLPERRDMADRIRSVMGINNPEDMNPEEQAQAEQAAQMQQAQAQQAVELQARSAMAEIAEREAKTAKLVAETKKTEQEVAQAPEREKALESALSQALSALEKTEIDAQKQVNEATNQSETLINELREALASAQMRTDQSANNIHTGEAVGN